MSIFEQFADIVGFTAWSSGREPAQVFVLLEKVYKAFDESAKKRGIFKGELRFETKSWLTLYAQVY